jgi:hypothetical protein
MGRGQPHVVLPVGVDWPLAPLSDLHAEQDDARAAGADADDPTMASRTTLLAAATLALVARMEACATDALGAVDDGPSAHMCNADAFTTLMPTGVCLCVHVRTHTSASLVSLSPSRHTHTLSVTASVCAFGWVVVAAKLTYLYYVFLLDHRVFASPTVAPVLASLFRQYTRPGTRLLPPQSRLRCGVLICARLPIPLCHTRRLLAGGQLPGRSGHARL